MKDEFITKVMTQMMSVISAEQCNELKIILHMMLQEYELTERCTEVMDMDKSYIHYLQLFLVRKKTEGKSEKTLKQYKLTCCAR